MRFRAVSVLISVITVVGTIGAGPAAAAGTQTISREVTIPAPPASAFAGTSGGDGFDVSLVNGRIYNVFHHGAFDFTVACLEESTGDKCDGGASSPWPKTLTDSTYGSVGSPGQSWTFVSPDKTKLYGWSQKSFQHGGIMCMDLTAASNTTNPSCGYTVLTAHAGETTTINPWSSQDWGSNARVGNRVYASFPSNNRSELWLACFDLSTGSQCLNAPYLVPTPSIGGIYPFGGRVAAIGSNVYISGYGSSTPFLTCWDTTANGACDASNPSSAWPVTVSSPYVTVPIMDIQGTISGVCSLAGDSTACLNKTTGETISTPSVLTNFFPGDWWGAATRVGTRLVIPDQNGVVHCVDFSASPAALCSGSPFQTSNLGLLYTASLDPQRAGCFWLNADNGSAQIQNFDIFTMTAGCAGSQRVSTSQFVPDLEGCPLVNWLDLTVTDPTTWTSAEVTVSNQGGASLPGGASLSLTANVPTSLAGVDFTSVPDPLFSFAFTGASFSATGIKVVFQFVTDGQPTCALPGDVVAPTAKSFGQLRDMTISPHDRSRQDVSGQFPGQGGLNIANEHRPEFAQVPGNERALLAAAAVAGQQATSVGGSGRSDRAVVATADPRGRAR